MVSRVFPLFSDAELEFLWWQFTMVVENNVPIVRYFVCYPCGCCCKIFIKDNVELQRNISSFYIKNQSNNFCVLRRYTKINILSRLRCSFWDWFLLTNFWIQGWSKSIWRYEIVSLYHVLWLMKNAIMLWDQIHQYINYPHQSPILLHMATVMLW